MPLKDSHLGEKKMGLADKILETVINETIPSYFRETDVKLKSFDTLEKRLSDIKFHSTAARNLYNDVLQIEALKKVGEELSKLQRNDRSNKDLISARSDFNMDLEDALVMYNSSINDVKKLKPLTKKDLKLSTESW